MRSAMADPQQRAAETLQEPDMAMVQYDQGQEEMEEQEEGGYRLTFNTSSVCFAGTGAQACHCAVALYVDILQCSTVSYICINNMIPPE